MDEVSVVHFEELEDDLKEFLNRAQRRSQKQSMRKAKEYQSPFVSENSVFSRVPLDGAAVLSIYDSKDRTVDLINRLMNLAMTQDVLVTLREYLKMCNQLEVRLQSLLLHIKMCPQYDLEIADINKHLEDMEKNTKELEKNTSSQGSTADFLERYGCLRMMEACGMEDLDETDETEETEGTEDTEDTEESEKSQVTEEPEETR